MSLFLGKIHFWLYNKIVWAEKAEDEIARWATAQGLPADQWSRQFRSEYGDPTENRPLEEIIDTSNIHGWLQDRIRRAELRQAALITTVLKEKASYKAELLEIFKNQGKEAALEYKTEENGEGSARFSKGADTPEEAYNALNDFILEGMPCDRGSQVISNGEEELVWQANEQLHTPYWLEVGGDIGNFYELRESWIASFIETLNPELRFEKIREGEYSIIRKK